MSYKTNLNTEKEKKILENLGIDTSALKTNLESELLDAIVEATEGGAGGGSGEEGSSTYNAVFKNTAGYIQFSNLAEWLIEIDSLDFTGVTNAYSGFSGYYPYLRRVGKILNAGSNKNTGYLFMNRSALEEAPEMDTSNVETMNYMFEGCTSLKIVPQYKADKVYGVNGTFSNNVALENFGGLLNLGKNYSSGSSNNSDYKLDLSKSTKLTHNSLMNVINGLYDLNLTYNTANGNMLWTQSLVLGADNLAKLSADEIAIATNKGWTVS